MTHPISRRSFLQDTAAATAAAAAASQIAPQCTSTAAAAQASRGDFASQWENSPDRVWLGPEYWSNPMQDWRVAGGRIECITVAGNRNVHVLTRQLGEEAGDLVMTVRIGRVGGGKLDGGPGSAGFRIGVMGPLREYRNSLAFGRGLDAGFTTSGRLFIGEPGSGVPIDLAAEEIDMELKVQPQGRQSTVTLTAYAAGGKELARTSDSVPSASLTGSLCLVANYASGMASAQAAAKGKKAKGKKKASASDAGAGTFWFGRWQMSGSRLVPHDERAFGPILFSQYTLHDRTLKMTAQMPPLGEKDTPSVELLIGTNRYGAPIHPQARTATFRVENVVTNEDTPYVLEYDLVSADGTKTKHQWSGTIRRDPVDKDVLTVADVSCNVQEAFPNTDYTAKMMQLNPDFIAFVGDQFYESTGGYGVLRTPPVEPAILDYLRKWYFHGWTWRELTRDRPSISIPDDHDVYQGNIWGESGAPQTTTQEAGGYNMDPAWVNVVHRTQTSHHPDPWDATPVKQGISVYSGPLTYGGVSFAILADRQFKSAPEGKVPPTGSRGDHVIDPDFDPKTADLPGLQLLGPMQLEHLQQWIRDWRGAKMKAVISQTIFTAMATTHGSPGGRLVADYDTNGWPQSERNEALRTIRKAFAVHLAGDQHLPAVVHYGIDEHRDAGIAFAGPAVNVGYPRWFEPREPGKNRKEGAPEETGDFIDSFGNPLTVIALKNGAKQPRMANVLEKLDDKASGLGVVRFDKKNRKITIECWPLLADVTQPAAQMPGWPVTFDMLDNYGKQPAALLPTAHDPRRGDPLVEVFDEAGELVYCLRIKGPTWQPHTFAAGKYTVRVTDPEAGKQVRLEALAAVAGNSEAVEVQL
jgi:alkaline phosphatase D